MSSTAYLELKRATQVLLDQNIEPTLEAFQYFFPHVVKDEIQFSSVTIKVDWFKHKHIETQRQKGIDVTLVPFQRPVTDTATHKKSRKIAANRVSLSPGNQDTFNASRRGCNDDGERHVADVALGSVHEGGCDRESMTMQEKDTCSKRKLRKISLDSSTVSFPTHESTEEASIALSRAEDKESSRGKDCNKVLDASLTTLPIKKRKFHMLPSNSTRPLDDSESVEAVADLEMQTVSQSQRNSFTVIDEGVLSSCSKQKNIETNCSALTVYQNEQEAEKGVRPVTPTDDESSLGYRKIQAANKQDVSVKKRKGRKASNNDEAELAQGRQLRKKTKLRIKISKPHMKKKQLDKISANNSIVNMEAPMKECPSRTSNGCVDSIAATSSKKSEITSTGSIYSHNTTEMAKDATEMAKDDLLDSSFLLTKESAKSTLSASECDNQLGTLINDPMLNSEKDEERIMNATSNHLQKSASSISNSQYARLNTDHRTADTNQLTQQYHLQQLTSSYQQAVATHHVAHPMISRVEEDKTKYQHIEVQNILQKEAEANNSCNSVRISSTEVLECDDSLKVYQGTGTMHVELPSKPIHFLKANDEEGYMKVKEIIEGMVDEGIQHPARKLYKKYPELTSKYEKRSLTVGIAQIVHRSKAKKATLHSELPSKPIHFTKANDEEGYMKVKEIIEGMVDDGIEHPASEFYEKYPELTSKYDKFSLSNRISGFYTNKTAKKASLLGSKNLASNVQEDASKHQHIEVNDAALQDEGDTQSYCDAAKKLNEQRTVPDGMDTMEKSIQLENIHYSDQDCSATLSKEREKHHAISGRSIPPTDFHYANKTIEEQDAIMSMIKLSATTTTNSPQQLASTSTAVMNASDNQGDAKSSRDSTNMEQTFKPIHFKKTKDEVGFLKVKEIIHGMMDEGVEDPQKEFFKKYPSLANKYEKGSIRRGVHSFCRNYNIKKANEEKKKQSLLLVQEKQGMLHAKAKIGLEKYCSSLKTSVSSPEVEGKIQADDKTKLEGAIDETLQWLDSNHFAEKEEFEEKQNTLEAIAAPLFEYLKALETKKCVVNEDTNFTHQYADENALSEQSKPIQIAEFDKFLEDKATSLAEWILVEIIKINSANVRSKCKEYADELIKLGFYDKEMMKNFCTVEIIDSEDFTSFMKLAHRLSLKKWLLEHGASK